MHIHKHIHIYTCGRLLYRYCWTRATAVYYVYKYCDAGCAGRLGSPYLCVCVCVCDRRGAVHWMTPAAWATFCEVSCAGCGGRFGEPYFVYAAAAEPCTG